jgi:hypothetical protein
VLSKLKMLHMFKAIQKLKVPHMFKAIHKLTMLHLKTYVKMLIEQLKVRLMGYCQKDNSRA